MEQSSPGEREPPLRAIGEVGLLLATLLPRGGPLGGIDAREGLLHSEADQEQQTEHGS